MSSGGPCGGGIGAVGAFIMCQALESCVSSESEVGGTLPGLMVGSLSVAGVVSPFVVGVGSIAVVGMGSVTSVGMGSFTEVKAGPASAGGVDPACCSMSGLKSPVSAGSGRLVALRVATGAWISLALINLRSNFTSSRSWRYMGSS